MTRHILLIDDEEAIRIILKASLEFTAGWKVVVASCGSEGIKSLKTEQPEAILLDVMMPEIDGISLFHQLQAQPETQNIPVIFLTAQAREVEGSALETLGAGVILKPFEPEAIANQIRTLLNWAD
ncbi:MAG: response regulator [Phormidesmis sp. RL_2_1]|nr:response regulator [Phormidesmis sp. RL_2_1]